LKHKIDIAIKVGKKKFKKLWVHVSQITCNFKLKSENCLLNNDGVGLRDNNNHNIILFLITLFNVLLKNHIQCYQLIISLLTVLSLQ